MTVIPKIKKFSRSKVVEETIEQPIDNIEAPVKGKRGRKPKQVQIIEEPVESIYEPDSPIYNSPVEVEPEEDNIDYNYQPEDDNFLEELNNVNYKEEVKEKPKNEKPIYYKSDADLLLELELNSKPKKQKAPKQQPTRSLFEDDDSIFGDVPTEILGRDKRELLTKITQYKNLFPTELKKFTVKKNANTQELQTALDEMEAIVDCSSLENFLTDSILQCIKLVEGVSTYSQRYNIEGCCDMLKTNPQFNSLCKRLYIKYKVFSEIPAEYQLILIVATTAYVCKSQNSKKFEINNYLNQQI